MEARPGASARPASLVWPAPSNQEEDPKRPIKKGPDTFSLSFEHKAGEQLRLGELLGAELVRIKWQHHGANLKGDCQNGLRRLACAHERSAGANLVPIIPVVTIMSGFLRSSPDAFVCLGYRLPAGSTRQ